MSGEFVCQVRVRLHLPEEKIMEEAAFLGTVWGRGENWKPKDLNEAVQEIILWSDAPIDQGVELFE